MQIRHLLISLLVFFLLSTTWNVESNSFESELLALVNNYRIEKGLGPLDSFISFNIHDTKKYY